MAYQNTAFYVDDSWKVNKNLSVEMGARIEHVGHWYDRNGVGMADFFPDRVFSDYYSGKVDPGFYWHAIDPSVPLSGQPNRLAFVSPRFGVSYDPFGTGKTVIRGGWGVYRFAGQYNDYASALTTAQGVKNLQPARTEERVVEPDFATSGAGLQHASSDNVESERRMRNHWLADWIGCRRLWRANHVCLEPYGRSPIQMEYAFGCCLRGQYQQPDSG